MGWPDLPQLWVLVGLVPSQTNRPYRECQVQVTAVEALVHSLVYHPEKASVALGVVRSLTVSADWDHWRQI